MVDREKLQKLKKLQDTGVTLVSIREHWEREACELMGVPDDKSRISKLVKSILKDQHTDVCYIASEVQVWKANQAFSEAAISSDGAS